MDQIFGMDRDGTALVAADEVYEMCVGTRENDPLIYSIRRNQGSETKNEER